MSYPAARFQLTAAEIARLEAIGAALSASAADLVKRYIHAFERCETGNSNMNMFNGYLGAHGYATSLRREIAALLTEFDEAVIKLRARARRVLSKRILKPRTANCQLRTAN